MIYVRNVGLLVIISPRSNHVIDVQYNLNSFAVLHRLGFDFVGCWKLLKIRVQNQFCFKNADPGL